MKRGSGVLLPVSSIPSKYGIGAFSKEAYEFIDKLVRGGQQYWQILPLGATGYGDSPYQSFSTFAGNPYYIDLEALIQEGLLTAEECDSVDFGCDERKVDYEKIYFNRFNVLRKAYERSQHKSTEEYKEFVKQNKAWLDDYALYMAVKNSMEGKSWIEWDEDIRMRQPEAITRYKKELKDEIDFYKFQQYKFAEQWTKLKNYANEKGIKIIGDIPIYVAFDSADAWAGPELFQFDENGFPTGVAGCPPDAFSATGQLWGNPLYDWDYHKKTGYKWWIKRISYCFDLYDVVRIDHFRGFDEYYDIPYGDKTAENGKWRQGPGIDLFKAMNKKLGAREIIAEDLGFLTDTVLQLLEDTGYPGMKVLQFAFDSREESDYLPHNYTRNSVVYTGTHDNDTLQGWYAVLNEDDKQLSKDYLNNAGTPVEDIHWDFIRSAMASVSNLCVIPVQDYLGLGNEARFNLPSTLGDNWVWRMTPAELDDVIIDKMYDLTKLYGRLASKDKKEEE